MLKKITHIALGFLILVSTTGYTINRHYCGNTLETISINSKPEPCCDIDGCCHDEAEHFQVKDDFCPTINMPSVVAPEIDVLYNTTFVTYLYKIFNAEFTSFTVTEYPPPLKRNTLLSFFQAYLC